MTTFFGIDKIDTNWRGGNMTQKISKNETEWIYKLNTLTAAGIDVDIDLHFYLSNH